MEIPITIPKNRSIKPEVFTYSKGGKKEDLSDYVQSITIDNSLDRPIATMQITFNFAMGKKLHLSSNQLLSFVNKKVHIYGLITCKIDRTSLHPDFVGIVRQKYPSVSVSVGSSSRSLTVNASLAIMHTLFRDSLPNAPVLQNNEIVKNVLGEARTQFFLYLRGSEKGNSPFVDSRPETAVRWILENAVSTNIYPYQPEVTFKTLLGIDKGKGLRQLVSKSDRTKLGDYIFNLQFLKNESLFDPTLSIYYGNIYKYIQRCLDPAFYEMFADSVTGEDGKYYNKFTIRPRPFSYLDVDIDKPGVLANLWTHWEELDTLIFDTSYRIREDIGMNEGEIKNFIHLVNTLSLLTPAGSDAAMYGTMFPIINLDSIKKYGVRELNAVSTMLNLDEFAEKFKKAQEESSSLKVGDFTKGDLAFILEKRNKIWEWFGFPFFESGSMTVLGHSDYRVGKRLYWRDRNYIFPETQKAYKGVYYYINKVRHTYRYPEYWTTTLGLTRGQPKNLVIDYLRELETKKDKNGNKLLIKIDDLSNPLGSTIGSKETKEVREKRQDIFEKTNETVSLK